MKKREIAAIVLMIAAAILAQFEFTAATVIAIGSLVVVAIIILTVKKEDPKLKGKYLTNEITVKISYTFMDPASQTALCALDTVITIPPQKVDTPPDQETYKKILNMAGETWLKDNVQPQYHIIAVKQS